MNQYHNYIIKSLYLIVYFSVIWYVPIAKSANDFVINLTVEECSVTAELNTENGCDQGQCSGDAACVCATKGDHIQWQLAGDDKIKFKFSSGSPLKDNCGKSFKKNGHKCVVKDDVTSGSVYDYEIYLERCDDGTDPKIIIK